MASKPEFHYCSGMSMAATYLLAMRCPVFRGRDPHLGFRTELENLSSDAKGKGREKAQAEKTVRLKVPMCWAGADCSVVVMKRGNGSSRQG